MAKLLHVQASPRRERSASRSVAGELLDVYRASHKEDEVETLDLWDLELPEMDPAAVDARYAIFKEQEHSSDQSARWARIRDVFTHFASADKYLFSVPMWNFGIPYRLKHYIDVITQPGLAFNYSDKDGYAGLVTGKPAAVVLARSTTYHWGSGLENYDYQRTYLETWLRFIGFTRVRSIPVDPEMTSGSGAQGKDAAIEHAREFALKF